MGKIGRRDGGNLKTGRFAWDCDTVNRSGVSGLCAIVDVGEYIILWTVSRVFYSRLSFFSLEGYNFSKYNLYTPVLLLYNLRISYLCSIQKMCFSKNIQCDNEPVNCYYRINCWIRRVREE